MKFLFPTLALLSPVLGLLFWLALKGLGRLKVKSLRTFAGDPKRAWAQTGASASRKRWAAFFNVIAFMAMLLALAGPMYFQKTEKSELQGVPYLIALDASRSMLAADVRPNRWSAATNALDHFLDRTRGDRVGLITFSGVAYLNAPLTFDMLALRTMLRYLDPNAIEDPGSSLASALERSGRYFESNHISPRLVIVVSDGEDLAGNPLEMARRLKRQSNLQICTIGVGSGAGARVPLNRYGMGAKNSFGQDVLSRLNENNLERLAAITGGRYYRLGDDGSGLEQLRREVLNPMAESAAREDLNNYRPLFQLPLTLALLFWLANFLLASDRSLTRRPLTSIFPRPASS